MLCEIIQSQKDKCCRILLMGGTWHSRIRDSRIALTRRELGKVMERYCSSCAEFVFEKMKRFCGWIMYSVQYYECVPTELYT